MFTGLFSPPSLPSTSRDPCAPVASAVERGSDIMAEANQGAVAVPAISVETYRVDHGSGFTMPVVSLILVLGDKIWASTLNSTLANAAVASPCVSSNQ